MRAFVRLVEVGTFSAVAHEMRVKQSTVSKWLAALEEELGVQLIERTTRTRRVTDAGQRFYTRAVDILAAYATATAELQEEAPELRGRLRVSVPVVFGRLYVVPHVAAYLTCHPKVEIELVFNDRYVNLVEESFDIAIRVGRPVDSSFRARKLGETGRRLVASPAYLDRHGLPTTPKDLQCHHGLLHTGLSAGDIWTFRDASEGDEGKARRITVRGRFAANNSEALLEMARSGLGIALLATWLVGDDLASGRLVELLTGYTLPRAPIHALMPPSRHVHPRVRSFLDFMDEALAEAFGE